MFTIQSDFIEQRGMKVHLRYRITRFIYTVCRPCALYVLACARLCIRMCACRCAFSCVRVFKMAVSQGVITVNGMVDMYNACTD